MTYIYNNWKNLKVELVFIQKKADFTYLENSFQLLIYNEEKKIQNNALFKFVLQKLLIQVTFILIHDKFFINL